MLKEYLSIAGSIWPMVLILLGIICTRNKETTMSYILFGAAAIVVAAAVFAWASFHFAERDERLDPTNHPD
jgi:ABC-type cobalamin transport system permease subunit